MNRMNWAPLHEALARLRAANEALPIWWRDDDATDFTPALEHLSQASMQTGLPVHLAVIPGNARPKLAGFAAERAHIVPVVHGWRHINHAPPDAKKAEFGRRRVAGGDDIAAARAAMDQVFGGGYQPLFVPPWNRFDASFLPHLKTNGFKGLSTFQPRSSIYAGFGIVQINTHIDPIDWRGSRDLHDPDHLILHTATLIHARLDRTQDSTEPLGYLTHHLVHTSRVWTFSESLLNTLLDGGATAQPIAPLLEIET